MASPKRVEYKFDKNVVRSLSRIYSNKSYLARPSNSEKLVISKERFDFALRMLKFKTSNLLRARAPRGTTFSELRERTIFCYIETGGRHVVDSLGDIYAMPIKVTDTGILISPNFEEAVRKKHRQFEGKINVVVFDDVFDSGETFLKVSNALREIFCREAIILNIVIATVFRRRTPDSSREDYGFSTLKVEELPFCNLVYGERVNSMKYMLLPWEKEKSKVKRKK